MGRTFKHRFRVRWSECDPQNIVFNAHYVAYFDMAITEFWRDVLGGYTSMVAAGTDLVVGEANVRYLGSAGFDDELEIEVAIAKLGTTSITSTHTVRKGDEIVVEGWLRHVFVDAKTMSKTSIPDHIRSRLEPYVTEPAGDAEGQPQGAVEGGREGPRHEAPVDPQEGEPQGVG